jgi:hypothetical protein
MIAARRLTPATAIEARAHACRPSLPADVRFALVVAPPPAKPFAYATLGELARAIHRRRQGRAIQLFNQSAHLALREDAVRGVRISLIDPIGERTTTLGWAYLGGFARQTLERALRQEES